MDFNFDVDSLAQALLLYIPRVVGALLVVLVGFWLAGKISRLIGRGMRKRSVDPSVIGFLESLVSVGIKVLVLISAAGMFGIETTSFVAILGALAFAVGLALQGSLGHFASGVLLLTFKPYRTGDLVKIGGGEVGVVDSIQIFNTVLRNADNHRVIVPNGTVTSNVITNISGQGTQGISLTFGIGYDDDIDKAREVILSVIRDCPAILPEPVPAVVVKEHGDSAVMLATRPHCNSADYWPTFFHLQEEVKKAFDREGISIPYPQRDVHLHKVD
jgi:small conductance mechanosensitive channel